MTKIGKFCSIGSKFICGRGDHPTNYVSTSPVFYSREIRAGRFVEKTINYNERKQIKIGHDVWIGDRVFLRDGVNIGNGAIIGAGAVVIRNIPDYAIVAGIPARIIRFRFTPEIIQSLLALKWWDWEDDKLLLAQPYIAQNDISLFIDWARNVE